MVNLRSKALVRRRTRLDLRKPSPSFLPPVERIGCDHVVAGAPVAGFTRARIGFGPGRDRSMIVGVDVVREQEVFVDLCAECFPLAGNLPLEWVSVDRRSQSRGSS